MCVCAELALVFPVDRQFADRTKWLDNLNYSDCVGCDNDDDEDDGSSGLVWLAGLALLTQCWSWITRSLDFEDGCNCSGGSCSFKVVVRLLA